MKRFLFILRHAPYGTAFGREGLDAILMSSAFVPTAVLLLGDGVFQLAREQHPETLDFKNHAATFRALEQYDVRDVYVSARDLEARALTVEQLSIPVTALSDDEIRELMHDREMILSF